LTPQQFSPGNTLLACQENNGAIMLADVAGGEYLEHTIPTKSFGSFSPSGSRILAINEQGHPQLWYTSNGKTATAPLEHETEVQDVGFSPDGRYVRVVCVDGTVRVWDGISGEPAAPLLKHIGAVTSSGFSRDGSHLMVVAGETVWLWPIGWPKFDQLSIALTNNQQRGGTTLPTSAAVISPDGKKVLTGTVSRGGLGFGERREPGQDTVGEMRVWDSASGQLTHGPIELQMGSPLGFLPAAPVFSADSNRILVADPGRGFFRGRAATSEGEEPAPPRAAKAICTIWNLTNNELTRLNLPEDDPATAEINRARFSSDGERVLTILGERTERPTRLPAISPQPNPKRAIVWDAQSGDPIGVPIECQSSEHEFSADGLRFAYAVTGDDDRDVVHVINTIDGSTVGAAIRHRDRVRSLAFCQDGELLLTVTWSGLASLWETESGQRRFGPLEVSSDVTSPSISSLQCAVSPSADKLAVFSSLRTSSTGLFGSGRASIPTPAAIRRMSPTVTLYGLRSKSRTLLQHEQAVTGASFSPESRYLMTSSMDNVIRVWDSASGQLIRTIRPAVAAGTLVSAVFSDDSQRIVTRAGNAIRVWEVATGQPLSPTLRSSSRRESAVGTRLFLGSSSSWNVSLIHI